MSKIKLAWDGEEKVVMIAEQLSDFRCVLQSEPILNSFIVQTSFPGYGWPI